MDYNVFAALFTFLWCAAWYGYVPGTAIGPHSTFVERTFSALQLSSLVHAHVDSATVTGQGTIETASSISSMLLPELENVLEKIKDVEVNRSAVVFYYSPATVTSVVPWTAPTSDPNAGDARMSDQFHGTSTPSENPFLAPILAILADTPWGFAAVMFSFLMFMGLFRNSDSRGTPEPSYAQLLERVNALEQSTTRNRESVIQLQDNFSAVDVRTRDLNRAVEGLQNTSQGQSTQNTGALSAIDSELRALRQSLGPGPDGLNHQQMIAELDRAKVDRKEWEEKLASLKSKVKDLKREINSKPDMVDYQNLTKDQEENASFHREVTKKFDDLLALLRLSLNADNRSGVSQELVVALSNIRKEVSSDTDGRLSSLNNRLQSLEQTTEKGDQLRESVDRLKKEIDSVKEKVELKTATDSMSLATKVNTLSTELQGLSDRLDPQKLADHACPISADFQEKLDNLHRHYQRIEGEVNSQKAKFESYRHEDHLPERQGDAESLQKAKEDVTDGSSLEELGDNLSQLAVQILGLKDQQSDLQSQVTKLDTKVGKLPEHFDRPREKEVSVSSTTAENATITEFRKAMEKMETDLETYCSQLEEVRGSQASQAGPLQDELKELKITVDGVKTHVLGIEKPRKDLFEKNEKLDEAKQSTASQTDLKKSQSQLEDFKNNIEGKLGELEKAFSQEKVGTGSQFESLKSIIGNAEKKIDEECKKIGGLCDEFKKNELNALGTRMCAVEKGHKDAQSGLEKLGKSVEKIEKDLPALVKQTTETVFGPPQSALSKLRTQVDEVNQKIAGLSSRVQPVEKPPQQLQGNASTPNMEKGTPLGQRFEKIEHGASIHERRIKELDDWLGETSKIARSHDTRLDMAFNLSSSCYDISSSCKKAFEKSTGEKVEIVNGANQKVLDYFMKKYKFDNSDSDGGQEGGEGSKGDGGHTESGAGGNAPEEALEEAPEEENLDDGLDSLFEDDSVDEEDSPPVKSAPTLGKYAVVKPGDLGKPSSKPSTPSAPTPSASTSVLDTSKAQEKHPMGKEKDPYAHISIWDPKHPRNQPKEAQSGSSKSVLDPSNVQKEPMGKAKNPFAHLSGPDPRQSGNKSTEAQAETSKAPETSSTGSKGKGKEKVEPVPLESSTSSDATIGASAQKESKAGPTEPEKLGGEDGPSQKDTTKSNKSRWDPTYEGPDKLGSPSRKGKGPALDTKTPTAPTTSQSSTPATPSPSTPIGGSGKSNRGKKNKNKRGGK